MALENNYGGIIMTWEEARKQIKDRVWVGDDVNSQKSHGRIVICVCDGGYLIPKAEDWYMLVTWDMLEKCWNGMVANGGVYDKTVFKKHYPKHAKSAGCYVQTIRMIFEKAGLP